MKRFSTAAALIAAGCLVALCAFELLLRGIGYSAPIWYQPHPQLGWTLRPGVAAWFTAEGRAFVEVNAGGWRDLEHARAKPADVYRIAVLGDSYAEAMQVKRAETFWALLPERLRAGCGFQSAKRIEVLNFGVSGYGTAQEYLTLETAALAYRPDLVLLQFTNGNDVRNNSFALEDERNRPFFLLQADGGLTVDRSFTETAFYRERSSAAWELIRKATDYSRVVQLVRAVREAPLFAKAQAQGAEHGLTLDALVPPREPRWEEAWRTTEALLSRTAGLAERNGARLVVVSVPYSVQVDPRRKYREELQAQLGVPDLFYAERRIGALAQRGGFEAVPIAPEMQRRADEQGTYFHGFSNSAMGSGHWNVAGHSAAAEIIAARICERLR